MKNLTVVLALALGLLMFSSCQKKKCSATQTYRDLVDSTLVTEKLEWETYGSCSDYYEAPGYQPGADVYSGYPNTNPNQNGGTPSTGGAPGTYTNPIEDYSVYHDGNYDVIITDPLFVNGPHPNLNSRLLLPDLNQDGSVDLESGGVANHFVEVRGVVLINGYYYKANMVTDENSFQEGQAYGKVMYGGVIPNTAMYSTKPYGYVGKPSTCPKVDGVYKISPGAGRFYFWLS